MRAPSVVQPADLSFFVALASADSFSAAARERGVSTAAVSRHLGQMEERLGFALLNRTTRRMSLTPEGEIYLDYARKIQADLDELTDRLLGSVAAPQGLLRINATLGFGRSHIAPMLSAFCASFPHVSIQLQLSVNPPLSTDDTYDICFRFGEPPDSRLVARSIAANRRIVVASPVYLKRAGVPKTPEDLRRHNCIGIRQGDEAYGLWRFYRSPTLERINLHDPLISVKVRGNLTTNDGGIAVGWALDGHGVLLRAEWDVSQHIASGDLVQVLGNYDCPNADIYAVYPERLRTSLRVKTLLDFASQHLGAVQR